MHVPTEEKSDASEIRAGFQLFSAVPYKILSGEVNADWGQSIFSN